MISVAYSSPFVPPEWIAAHQMRPIWLPGSPGITRPAASARRGVCRCAGILVDGTWKHAGAEAIVLTTICDQMRYAAAYVHESGEVPVFLFNVPSTWQSPEVRQLYREELCRLGRFLESLGGCRAFAGVLAAHDAALRGGPIGSARELAARVRWSLCGKACRAAKRREMVFPSARFRQLEFRRTSGAGGWAAAGGRFCLS